MSGREIVRSLVFTTPAFLAGADQNAPEIRAPSVRGALRWWFRVLGGTLERERDLFGSVHGTPVASPIVVRVEPGKPGNNAKELRFGPTAPLGYVGYFAAVSGNKVGIHRTAPGHYLGADTAFTLRIWERRPVADDLWEALEGAVTAFCRLGALGLRATRGFGMVAEAEPPTAAAFRAWAATLAPRGIHLWEGPAADALRALADALRALRHERHISGKDKSALDFSDRSDRHASALRLCPVRVADGLLPVLLYTDAASSQKTSCLPAVRDFLPRHGFSPLT